MIVSLYQCDAEFRIFQILQELISETGLEERGIATSNLLMQGHPLFELQAAKEKDDSIFPRIGVDWQSEHEQEQDLGHNYKLVCMPSEREHIKQYQCRGADGQYEQLSFQLYEELLGYKGYAQKHVQHRQSLVEVTGWASGAHARKTAQWLYMALKSTLPFLILSLREQYRVVLREAGQAETNIRSAELGHNLHGFALTLELQSLVTVYRLLPDYKPPRHIALPLRALAAEMN